MSARPEDRNPRDVLIDALDSWIRPDAAADVALAALRAAGYVVEREQTVAALVEALTECASDLAELVEAHYGRSKDYTSMKAKYDRDMEPVKRARHLIARVRRPA